MDRALLVGLNTGDKDFDSSMEELKNLAEACEFEVVSILIQNLAHPIAATYIGRGKVDEICDIEVKQEIDCCIFEDTLSPVQLKNLQKSIKARILDRTGLILEIFSKRARTREAKLQVESAKLQYMMPRLIGMWEAIGRQGGSSGSSSNRGIGETQLELDRRWIQKRNAELRRELEAIEHDRDIQRRKRSDKELPLVALVGYTNAGKSTIMNRLLAMSNREEEKQVFEKDMLFATLDTSVRRIETVSKKDFLLSDTVGFLDKLPHALIKAFRSTLDEIKYADLLLEVVDISDERHIEQMRVTDETIRELGAETIPRIYVMNKCDKLEENADTGPFRAGAEFKVKETSDRIYIAAGAGKGIEELVELIQKKLYSGHKTVEFMIDYAHGAVAGELSEKATILEREYKPEGLYIKAEVSDHIRTKYKEMII